MPEGEIARLGRVAGPGLPPAGLGEMGNGVPVIPMRLLTGAVQ